MIVGVSDPNGIDYAIRLLRALAELRVESHLVVSKFAATKLADEADGSGRNWRGLADVSYRDDEFGAPIASESFRTLGMIVVPCAMQTVGEIASCTASNLLARAADACLKARRRLVLVIRETPLHLGHLRAMIAATESGAIMFPTVPSFRRDPRSLDDLSDHTISRVLDLFELEPGSALRGDLAGVSLAPVQF